MKHDRQLATVLNLAVPPHSFYEMRTYKVCVVNRDTLEVTRSYAQPGHKAAWHECTFVGPRGGCKTIYKNHY